MSTIEIDRDGPSYTSDTLEALRAERLAAGESGELALILSVEALAGLATWHEPARVLELATLVVAPRDGFPDVGPEAIARLVPGADARVVMLDGPRMRLSASEIRARAAAGRSLRYLVPDAVAAYIGDHALYTEPGGWIDRDRTRAFRPRGHEPRRRAPMACRSAIRPPPRAASAPPLDLARRIVELAEDKKAADIVLLELAPLTTLADYFVICSGGSERQLEAIADGVISSLRDDKVKPIGREGTAASHWVLIDFGSVIVHIFTPPERDYYGLEKHWSEARTILRVQ